jgi:hypothetical protein
LILPKPPIRSTFAVLETFDRVVIEVRAAVATPGQTEQAKFLRDLAVAMILILGRTLSALATLPIQRATMFD